MELQFEFYGLILIISENVIFLRYRTSYLFTFLRLLVCFSARNILAIFRICLLSLILHYYCYYYYIITIIINIYSCSDHSNQLINNYHRVKLSSWHYVKYRFYGYLYVLLFSSTSRLVGSRRCEKYCTYAIELWSISYYWDISDR